MHLEERGCERGTPNADGIALNKSNYQHYILLTTNVGIARIRADSSGDQVLSGVAWKSRLSRSGKLGRGGTDDELAKPLIVIQRV
jgi:hypothetical protein